MKRAEEYLTVKEVAEILRVHLKSVYRMIDHGDIYPVWRMGRNIRVPRSTIDEMLKLNEPSYSQ